MSHRHSRKRPRSTCTVPSGSHWPHVVTDVFECGRCPRTWICHVTLTNLHLHIILCGATACGGGPSTCPAGFYAALHTLQPPRIPWGRHGVWGHHQRGSPKATLCPKQTGPQAQTLLGVGLCHCPSLENHTVKQAPDSWGPRRDGVLRAIPSKARTLSVRRKFEQNEL